eukprot:6034454-Pyramimonas_sp.AAC.1
MTQQLNHARASLQRFAHRNGHFLNPHKTNHLVNFAGQGSSEAAREVSRQKRARETARREVRALGPTLSFD